MTFALSAVILFAGASLWLAFYPPVPPDLGGAPDLDARSIRVSIPLAGDSLAGWWLPGEARGLIVLFAGYGRDHHRTWRYAAFLHNAGYDVLAVDFRSVGLRQRQPTTLGGHEQADAAAALAWANRRASRSGERVALFGESLGGSVAMVTAARHPEVAAVIADCPFASGGRAIGDTFHHWTGLPASWASTTVSPFSRAVTGYDATSLDVLAAADSLVRRPLLMIAGELDDRMSPEQSRDLARASGGELWLTPYGHNQAWQREPKEYARRVLEFLGRVKAFGRTRAT